ncbi:MAG: hypothetical protein Q8Q95_00490 [bacterium]|nr:hypothetical protein [bacterium]
MEPEKKPKLGMMILGIVVVVLIGFLWWKYKGRPQQEETVPTLGQKISDEVKAPSDAVPDVNPYKAETNPFEKANPFSDVYKNPFEK